uniref:Uncharacterized protein n=1 Tax=Salix viminalis TaxID=40686 RepID=A0A6N2LDB1_SALVM
MIMSWISTSCLFLLMSKETPVCSAHTFAAGQLCLSVNCASMLLSKPLATANEVEIYLVREMNSKVDFSIFMSTPISKPGIIDPCKDQLQVLEEQETLGGLKTNNFIHGHLILAYRKKVCKSE